MSTFKLYHLKHWWSPGQPQQCLAYDPWECLLRYPSDPIKAILCLSPFQHSSSGLGGVKAIWPYLQLLVAHQPLASTPMLLEQNDPAEPKAKPCQLRSRHPTYPSSSICSGALSRNLETSGKGPDSRLPSTSKHARVACWLSVKVIL